MSVLHYCDTYVCRRGKAQQQPQRLHTGARPRCLPCRMLGLLRHRRLIRLTRGLQAHIRRFHRPFDNQRAHSGSIQQAAAPA